MVYSIDSKTSFDNIEKWLRDLRTLSNPDVKVFLIGNKIDLENQRQVTKEMGEKFCKENNLHLFMESSAKTGVNAKNIFIQAAKILYDDYLKYQKELQKADQNENQKENENKKINNKKIDNKPKKNQGGCC